MQIKFNNMVIMQGFKLKNEKHFKFKVEMHKNTIVNYSFNGFL